MDFHVGYFGYKHQQSNQKTQSPAAQLADLDAKITVRSHCLCFSVYLAEQHDSYVVFSSQLNTHASFCVAVDRR